LNRVDLDLTFVHTVTHADSNMGTRPDSHTASDFSATYPLAKPFGERHEQRLHPVVQSPL
jgi:hypothetical protein